MTTTASNLTPLSRILHTLIVLSLYIGAITAQNPIYRQLSNDKLFPLVGIGLGNQNADVIPELIMDAAVTAALDPMEGGDGVMIAHLMIDTAHASQNEELIAKSLVEAAIRVNENAEQPIVLEVDLISKVWYTHLGYARTYLSVEESLNALTEALESDLIHLHVTMMLHWSKCHQDISWMECEEEELRLPNEVRSAGPDPMLNSETAWKDSWHALEEIYKNERLYAIGVSNFSWEEINELLEVGEIIPHIYQGSLYQLLNDPYLTRKLDENRILYVAYGSMSQIVASHDQYRDKTPNAFNMLQEVGSKYDYTIEGEEDSKTILTSVLAWLVQSGVAVIPRSRFHAKHNSPTVMKNFPTINEKDRDTFYSSVRGILRGEDISTGVVAHVKNTMNKAINLFWVNPSTGEEIHAYDGRVAEIGDTMSIVAHPGHEFIIRDAENLGIRKHFTVSGEYGEELSFNTSEL